MNLACLRLPTLLLIAMISTTGLLQAEAAGLTHVESIAINALHDMEMVEEDADNPLLPSPTRMAVNGARADFGVEV